MLAPLLTIILSTLPYSGTIAFVSYAESAGQIAVLDLESRSVTAIGPGNSDGPPVWSPDGSKLAFSSATPEGRSINNYSLGDRQLRRIPHTDPINEYPSWNPAGTRLAYQSGRFPYFHVSVYDLSTETERQWGNPDAALMQPRWLTTPTFVQAIINNMPVPPVGSIELKQGSLAAIYLVQQDSHWTTNLVAVTPDLILPFPNWNAVDMKRRHSEWSLTPANDDRAFVYESNDGGDREVFLANRLAVFDLSNHRTADFDPIWSPDEKWIAFESFRDIRRGIYRAHRDSGRLYTLFQSPAADFWSPTWAPDSEHLVCVTNQNGIAELCITSIDPINIEMLGVKGVGYPVWQPR